MAVGFKEESNKLSSCVDKVKDGIILTPDTLEKSPKLPPLGLINSKDKIEPQNSLPCPWPGHDDSRIGDIVLHLQSIMMVIMCVKPDACVL